MSLRSAARGLLAAFLVSSAALWLGSAQAATGAAARPLVSALWLALDTPVSALNAALPADLQSPIAMQFLPGPPCFPRPIAYELSSYLPLGTVAYSLLFLVFNGLRTATRRIAAPQPPGAALSQGIGKR